MLLSDLSDESRYAMEWGIGTVLRDGDELYVDQLPLAPSDQPASQNHRHRGREREQRQALSITAATRPD
jgi:hypothetical protein